MAYVQSLRICNNFLCGFSYGRVSQVYRIHTILHLQPYVTSYKTSTTIMHSEYIIQRTERWKLWPSSHGSTTVRVPYLPPPPGCTGVLCILMRAVSFMLIVTQPLLLIWPPCLCGCSALNADSAHSGQCIHTDVKFGAAAVSMKPLHLNWLQWDCLHPPALVNIFFSLKL